MTETAKITHGRHCTCSACAREDWTNPDLAPCGMHGSSCPRSYQPIGAAGASVVPSNRHRVVLEFDDGCYVKKLIHPEGGCIGAHQCGHCAADLTDPDSKRCYDCEGDGPHECWVETWFDNSTPEELLHGELEVEIDSEWAYDHMEAHIVGASHRGQSNDSESAEEQV